MFGVGCGSSDLKGPKLLPVKGTVTLDGKPMETGEVIFTASGNAAVAAFEVKGGSFSGEAAEGENKVAVMMYKDAPPIMMGDQKVEGQKTNVLPAKYNHQTTLSAKVAESGANEFKFDVTSN